MIQAAELDKMEQAYDEVHTLDNRLMHEWYPKRVLRIAKGDSFLELGLGHGHSASMFAAAFQRYTVVEGSPEMIRRFTVRHPDLRVDIQQGFFETFETQERFDHIGMGFVLEHVEDAYLVLRRFARFLKPSGSVIVAVPNSESLHRRVGHAAGMLPDMTALSAGDLQFGHVRYLNVQTLTEMVQSCGYEIVLTEGIFLKPVTTGQLESLRLSESILRGLMEVGVAYPELCNAILMQLVPKAAA